MKIIAAVFTTAFLLLSSHQASADLANAMSCSSKENLMNGNDPCTMVLIGVIDSIYGLKLACADGKTSYGYLIKAWIRDIERYPERQGVKTVNSMQMTMVNQGLNCK